jgi:hypothetical protein
MRSLPSAHSHLATGRLPGEGEPLRRHQGLGEGIRLPCQAAGIVPEPDPFPTLNSSHRHPYASRELTGGRSLICAGPTPWQGFLLSSVKMQKPCHRAGKGPEQRGGAQQAGRPAATHATVRYDSWLGSARMQQVD